MKIPNSILVGIDFCNRGGHLAEGARSVAIQSLALAKQTGAKLEFLYSSAGDSEEEWNKEVNVRAAMEEWRGLCIEAGHPTPELVEVQKEPWLAMIHRVLSGQNDLVMVAKRNQARRTDRRFGSVSMKLVRKCPCPVWVVNPGQGPEKGPILAATDLGDVGNHAVQLGAALAGMEGRDLFIVHAWQIPFELQVSASHMGDQEYAGRIRAQEDEARVALQSLPGVSELGDRAHLIITLGAPSEAILAAERKLDPSLTVMGSVGRGGIPGFLMGNTAERLLYKLESSVLVVKPEDFVCPVS